MTGVQTCALPISNALAIHPATGEVYVAGYTTSTDFPKVAGAEQAVKGGVADAFVTRLNANTLHLMIWMAFLMFTDGNGDACRGRRL